MKTLPLTILLVAGAAAAAFGKPPLAPPDKSEFHLFHPTPDVQMRELSTDRPDVTESPYTVDAGHFQAEIDAVRYTRDRHNAEHSDTTVETWSFGEANLKMGLLNSVDLQLVVPAYQEVRTRDRETATVRQQGYGDFVTRLKWNLWGNDGGQTALALMPFVKFPTASDDLGNSAVEGGLIVPLAISLPGSWSMGLMAEVDFLEDADGHGFHTEVVNSITVSHDLTERLGCFVEFVSVVTSEPGGDWIGQVDLGLTYAVGENVQLDAGVNLGVSRAADDLSTFVGLSWRF